MKTKLILIAVLTATLQGCILGGRAKQAEENYQVNYGGYLQNQSDCFEQNKHDIEFVPEGATAPVNITLSAGDCDNVETPTHGGAFVAQTETALIGAGATLGGALITAGANVITNNDNNDTRERIAELQNIREDQENAVLIEAITANTSQTDAITELTNGVLEQNSALSDLVDTLTAPEVEEVEEGEALDDVVADDTPLDDVAADPVDDAPFEPVVDDVPADDGGATDGI